MSDYSWLGPAIQAGASVAGHIAAGKDDELARQYLERILAGYEGLDIPDLAAISPELIGSSDLGGLTADPELEAAQRLALANLGQYTDDGISARDRAEMSRLANATSRAASRNQAAIRDDMAARGLGGSGAAYALMRQAGQDASERAAQGALDLSAQAMRQRLQAVRDTGDLAGQMTQAKFDRQSRSAAARDEMKRFNASARERANMHNASLPERQYAMALQRQRGMGDALGALSGNRSDSAQATRELGAGLGKAGYEAFRGSGETLTKEERDLVNAFRKGKGTA